MKFEDCDKLHEDLPNPLDEMLLTESNLNQDFFDSEQDENGEPRHVKTEPFYLDDRDATAIHLPGEKIFKE